MTIRLAVLRPLENGPSHDDEYTRSAGTGVMSDNTCTASHVAAPNHIHEQAYDDQAHAFTFRNANVDYELPTSDRTGV